MRQLTLAEEVMLLSLDDDTGAGRQKEGAAWALAGGALVELVLAGRLEVGDERLEVVDGSPLGVPHLDGALAAVGDEGTSLKTRTGLERVRKGIADATTHALVERGLLREERKKVLGLFPVTRYPEADGAPEEALRRRLAAVVLEGADPDERTAALVALLHGARLRALAFPGEDGRAVEQRMKHIAEGQWVQPAVRRALDEAQAVIAAVVVTTVTTTVIAGQ